MVKIGVRKDVFSGKTEVIGVIGPSEYKNQRDCGDSGCYKELDTEIAERLFGLGLPRVQCCGKKGCMLSKTIDETKRENGTFMREIRYEGVREN